MKRFLIFIPLLLMVTVISSVAAQDLPKFKARVKVSVSADENIKGMVTSYINRELRSLQDVEVVDRDPEWELQILAMEVSTKGGYKSGIVLSVVILSKFSSQILLPFVSGSYKEAVDKLTSNLYYYPDHWLIVDSTKDLKQSCIGIVADFDTKYLEQSRKINRELMKTLRKSKKTRKDKP